MDEVITLDNGTEYLILDKEEIDGTIYTLFVNEKDNSDFCFRKTVIEDGKRYYAYLNDKKEFEKVLLVFTKKNLNSQG